MAIWLVVFAAAKIAVETVDLCLARVKKAVDETGSILLVTADHGNADEMYEKAKEGQAPKPKTSHTLNPVPCIIYDNFGADNYTVKTEGSYGLSNIAATLVNLMGYKAPDFWDESMIELKK